MSWINLNGNQYSLVEILNFDSAKARTEFERSTIEFCQAWLSGKKEFVIQTSGSTGSPKKIILLRHQMTASAQQTIDALKLKSDFTSLVCLDTKYIAGQMMLVRSFLLGMNIVAVEPTSNPFEKIGPSLKIDFTALVPLQLETILNYSIDRLDQLKKAIIGGATIGNSTKAKVQETKCEVFATYGMTETISHIALQRLNGENRQQYFETLDNTQLRLDERGCLCIRTNYLKEEIVTNDLVELIDDKRFKWLGRFDNVINSGGVKIIPEKLEEVFERILKSHSIKQRFFITGIPDEKLGQKVVIVIEGESFENKTQQEIILEVSQHLSKYEIPKEFLFQKIFKETANGKIKRKLSLE